MQFKTFALVISVMIATAEAQARFTRVQGTVYCTADSSVDVTTVPVFPFAEVKLKCTGDVIEYEARTNAAGIFTIVSLITAQFPVPIFVNHCYLRVPTDLSKCDSELPSDGHLISSLSYIGDTTEQPGNFNFSNFVPIGFRYIPS